MSAPTADPFPDSYHDARSRFRLAVEGIGVPVHSWPIGPEGDDLTIDAARVGPDDAPGLVVLSSGLHGVEGPIGSAVQSSWLEGDGPRSLPSGVAVLLIHALNPFGFLHSRRFDAGNIDLNRNFLPPGSPFSGSPPLYDRLDPILNPPRPPSRLDPAWFAIRTILVGKRYGWPALKQAVAQGQHDFPLGLFFGGLGPSGTYRILDRHLPPLIEPSRSVVHLDFHTGLGPRGTFRLLADGAADAPATLRLVRAFGPEAVEPLAPGGTAYQARGTFDSWCASRFGIDGRIYDACCAEFGTYSNVAVLSALRIENQAFHHAPAGAPARVRARARLRECFIPADPPWRRWALAEGLDLVGRAVGHVSESAGAAEPLGTD